MKALSIVTKIIIIFFIAAFFLSPFIAENTDFLWKS